MSKSKKLHNPKRILTLAVLERKGAKILVQCVDNVFQFIIYYKDNFYSSYNVITSEKPLNHTELTAASNLAADQAYATLDMLIAKDSNEDLTKTHEQGAAIVEELDKAFSGQKPHRT